MELTFYHNVVPLNFLNINDVVTICLNKNIHNDYEYILKSKKGNVRGLTVESQISLDEFKLLGEQCNFLITEKKINVPTGLTGFVCTSIDEEVLEDSNTQSSNSNIFIPVELTYLFNDACVEVLDKTLKGEKVNITFESRDGVLYGIYNNEPIACDECNKTYVDYNFNDVKYNLDSISIKAEIPENLFDKNKISYSSVLNRAKEIGYSREKMDYLINSKLPAKLIMRLLETVSKTDRIDKKPDVLFIDDCIKVKACLVKILNGGHIRLFGSKSTGKNTLADTLIWLLERKSYKFSSNPQSDKGDIVGETGLITITDGSGKTHVVTNFQAGVLTKAMSEGAILLFDEINTNDAGLLSILHGACDDSKIISTPNGDIKAKENFCVIATMNEQYAGTAELNPALVDRMLGIYFEPPKDISEVLVTKRPKTPKYLLDYINNAYQKILILMKDEVTDDSPFSIRGFIDVIDLVEYGFSKEEAINLGIINRIQESDYRNSVKNSLEIC